MRGRLGDVGFLFLFFFLPTPFTSRFGITLVTISPFHRGSRGSADRMEIWDENGGLILHTGDQNDDRGLLVSPLSG